MVSIEICADCYFDDYDDDAYTRADADRANERAIKATIVEVLESKGFEADQYEIKRVPRAFVRNGQWLRVESYREDEYDDELSHSDVKELGDEIDLAVAKWVFEGE